MRGGILVALALLLGAGACAQKPMTPEPAVDAKWVEGVSREHNHEILKCYEDALKKDRKLQGNLQMEVDASATGEVSAVVVKQGVSAVFDACAQSKAKAWKYPWIKAETKRIQENFRLYLNPQGNPMAEFGGPAMDQEQVKLTVKAHMAEIEGCYAKYFPKGRGKQEGQLLLTWDILGSGEVTNVKIKEWFDPKIDKCIVDKVAKWKFPPPPNNVVANVTYPFKFNPSSVK